VTNCWNLANIHAFLYKHHRYKHREPQISGEIRVRIPCNRPVRPTSRSVHEIRVRPRKFPRECARKTPRKIPRMTPRNCARTVARKSRPQLSSILCLYLARQIPRSVCGIRLRNCLRNMLAELFAEYACGICLRNIFAEYACGICLRNTLAEYNNASKNLESLKIKML